MAVNERVLELGPRRHEALAMSLPAGINGHTIAPMRALALLACSLLLVGVGCSGSKRTATKAAGTQTVEKRVNSGGGTSVILESRSVSAGLAGVPAAALPGITVLGHAERSATPDRALVALTIGSGQGFGSNGPTLELVTRKELAPIVDALSKAGADQIAVDRFGQGPYGPSSAAQINFTLTHPSQVDTVLAAAQQATRKHTDYNIQAAAVLFTFSNCEAIEREAWQAALANAATRAQGLATLSHLKLGRILAVSEATSSTSPYLAVGNGCEALRHPQANIVVPNQPENTDTSATVTVTLQVTYAVASR